MTVFFTADLHLGHKRILEFEPARQELGDTPDEMNEALIERWNEVVTADDTVYVLGDWAMGTIADTLALTPRFNGSKRLVIGNHDRPYNADTTVWWDRYLDAGFDSLMFGPLVLDKAPSVLLNHFPFGPAGPYDGRYADDHVSYTSYMMLLHGHVHSAWKRRQANEINVGCDVWDYRPITLEQALQAPIVPLEVEQ